MRNKRKQNPTLLAWVLNFIKYFFFFYNSPPTVGDSPPRWRCSKLMWMY